MRARGLLTFSAVCLILCRAVCAQTDGGERGALFADTLRSGGRGPEMVAIAPGRFLMGCVSGILCSDEAWAPPPRVWGATRSTPVREVDIAQPYALSVHEITREEFAVFARRTGYRTDAEFAGAEFGRVCIGYSETDWSEITTHTWEEPGFEQRGDHPAVCVSWNDASEYARWLASETGRPYRLPSEAEWEYAARANTPPEYADRSWYCAPERASDVLEIRKCMGLPAHTVAVRDLAPNAFGLRGMDGNAYEWVEDCWFGDYRGAPSDGSAWTSNGGCPYKGRQVRVVRGGGWGRVVRHESRESGHVVRSDNMLGFRVAQSHAE